MHTACRLLLLMMMMSAGRAAAQEGGSDAPGGRILLATRNMAYLENADGRPVASVTARLVCTPGGVCLVLGLAAEAPGLVPPRGYRGRRGANVVTARELQALLRDPGLTLRPRTGPESVPSSGRVVAVERGLLPIRRLRPDGSLEHQGRTARLLTRRVVLETSPIPPGHHRWALQAGGRALLLLGFQVEPGGGRLTELRRPSVPDGAASATSTWSDGEPRDPVDPETWGGLDMDARWALFKRSLLEDPAGRPHWVPFLVRQKDYAFLEWLALYELDGYGPMGAGPALVASGDLRWVRAAARVLEHPDSHTMHLAAGHLRSRREITGPWLRRHGGELGEQARKLAIELTADGAGDGGGAPGPVPPPPRDEEELFPHLRTQAEPEESDPVAVWRALRTATGLVISGRRDPVALAALERLTRHPHPEVRAGALRAWTRVDPRKVSRADLPLEVFEGLFKDADQARRVRTAALMAWVAAGHPGADLVLLDLAGDPRHPLWETAVSLLGDVGDGYVLHRLRSLEREKLEAARVAFLEREVQRVAAAWPPPPAGRIRAPMAGRMLRRLAWARSAGRPEVAVLEPWTLELLAGWVHDPQVRERVQELAGKGPGAASLETGEEGGPAFITNLRSSARAVLEDGEGR